MNTVDPNETVHYEPSHLDLVFANSAIVVFGAIRFKFVHQYGCGISLLNIAEDIEIVFFHNNEF